MRAMGILDGLPLAAPHSMPALLLVDRIRLKEFTPVGVFEAEMGLRPLSLVKALSFSHEQTVRKSK